ncbi:hypothetical protein BBJ28_00009859 [Nothophytophthora sp. Chile5]|nr:hypothetical protein BBJ28_00009859 [Nothophytophthora sp. Chile5]
MASTLLDELPCLLDEAEDLMARLSCHMELLSPRGLADTLSTTGSEATGVEEQAFKPDLRQRLAAIDMDAISKFFGRQFLTSQPVAIEKVNAVLPVGEAQLNALHAFTATIYQLLRRLHHWQQTAWEALTRFFADSNSTSNSDGSKNCMLTFDSHPVLTRLVLSTVAKYVKTSMFWCSFNAIPGLLALYEFLQHTQTLPSARFAAGTLADGPQSLFSPLEHTDHRVREFVLHFGSNPLSAIQRDFQQHVTDGGAALTALTLSCFERFNACCDLAQLRHQGVFDLEALVGGSYASHLKLVDLLAVSDISDWVVCTALCVPHQLQGKDKSASAQPAHGSASLQLWDFLELVARDRLVLVLHRYTVVNLHDLLFQQLMSSLSTAAPAALSTTASRTFGGGRQASTSLKRIMNVISKQTLRTCGSHHRQRREIVVWLLQSCVQLLQHNPALLAPSFPLLLAALAMASDELEWLVCHAALRTATGSNEPSCTTPLLPSHVKPKHLQRVLTSFAGVETELAALLPPFHRLRGLVERHAHFLEDYYQVFLAAGDAEGIQCAIQDLQEEASSSSIAAMMPLLEGFSHRERYAIDLSSPVKATWAREWRQTNAHFAAEGQVPLLRVLRERMEQATQHAQFVSDNDRLLEHAARFSKCWWFRDIIFDRCFEHALLDSSPPSSPIALLEILASLAAGDYALEEVVDKEDAASQSRRMIQILARMMKGIIQQLEIGLENVVRRDVALQRDETSLLQESKPGQKEAKPALPSRRTVRFSRTPLNAAEVRQATPTTSQLLQGSSGLQRNRESNTHAKCQYPLEQLDVDERCLALASELLVHLAQDLRANTMKNAIVQRLQACFTRFLRSLVTFPSSSEGVADIVTLRCPLRDARVEIQCFLRATQRLFGGGGCKPNGNNDEGETLDDALQTALARSLAVERSSSDRLADWALDAPWESEEERQHWRLVDRLAWFYVTLVTRRSCPDGNPALLLVSVRKQCFLPVQEGPEVLDPREYTSHGALNHLVALVGRNGVDVICTTLANVLVAQVQTLRSTLEAEHQALLAIDAALGNNDISTTNSALAIAIAELKTLDDLATQFIRIGTTAFLLQLLHAFGSQATGSAWQTRVTPLLEQEERQTGGHAAWRRLLPAACAAGFYASVWRRSTYLVTAEAVNTNAHMMGLAMARLLPPPHRSLAVRRCAVAALARVSTCGGGGAGQTSNKGKLQLQHQAPLPEANGRALLEAMKLLVAEATLTEPDGDADGSFDLAPERLLPQAVLVLRSES